MKKVAWLALFLSILPQGARAAHTANLNQGEPGCVALVSGQTVTDASAKALSKPCQEFREAYLMELDLFAEHPDKLETEIKAAIRSSVAKKSAKPPYYALVLAVFTQNSNLKDDLKKRAEFEHKSKVIYSYGAAALERLQDGKCTHFAPEAYDEICNRQDPSFQRIHDIHAAQKGSGH